MKLLYGSLVVGLLLYCPVEHVESFLPENDMYIGPDQPMSADMNENAFNQIISSVEQVYAPIIKSKGGNLIVQKLWNNGTVNAQAERQGSNYIVKIFGGIARHSSVTADGLAVVVCHEVGHHLGGAPKMYNNTGWASVEGESDYWATLKCLRKVWKGADNEQVIQREGVDPLAEKLCNQKFPERANAFLCMRSIMGAKSVSRLFANGADVYVDKPDPRQVNKIDEQHPQGQCRFDTYVNAALCLAHENIEVNDANSNIGSCTNRSDYGARPRCWFYNPSEGGGASEKVVTPTIGGQFEYTTSDPNARVDFFYDVKNFSGAEVTGIEVSKADTPFPNPNGTEPAPADKILYAGPANNATATIQIYTSRLPKRGTYYFRVIPLTKNGMPVAPWSNPSALHFR